MLFRTSYVKENSIEDGIVGCGHALTYKGYTIVRFVNLLCQQENYYNSLLMCFDRLLLVVMDPKN